MGSRWPAHGWRRCRCVWPAGVRPRSMFPPPDSLVERLAATTDANGKGQIQGCRAEDLEAVLVEAAGFGLQGSELRPCCRPRPRDRTEARGRLTGRVQVDDPAAARGLEVIARTWTRASVGPRTLGEGRATTNAEGHFEIPALAGGTLALNVLVRRGHKASTQASLRPHDRARQDHRGHDPDGGPPARADGGGPCGRSRRPARRRCDRVPVGRFPGSNRSRDRRGWAIHIERGGRAANVPVCPESRVTASVGSPSRPSPKT